MFVMNVSDSDGVSIVAEHDTLFRNNHDKGITNVEDAHSVEASVGASNELEAIIACGELETILGGAVVFNVLFNNRFNHKPLASNDKSCGLDKKIKIY